MSKLAPSAASAVITGADGDPRRMTDRARPGSGICLLRTDMKRLSLKRVPVVCEGKLVGIVSRADLLDALVQGGQRSVSEASARPTG